MWASQYIAKLIDKMAQNGDFHVNPDFFNNPDFYDEQTLEISQKGDSVNEAMLQGRKAASMSVSHGLERGHNPFGEGTAEAGAWFDGWDEVRPQDTAETKAE